MNEIIDRGPLSGFQIGTLALCAAVMVLDGYDTQGIGFLLPAMAEYFGTPVAALASIISAGLFGLMLGALGFGWLADRLGRRRTAIAATLIFSVFTLATAQASSISELILFRFLTGVGLGGAVPNVIALASEYSPRRVQSTFVAWLFAGMPAGAILAGITSIHLLPTWGWRSVFYVGGILPLVLVVLLVMRLPESVRFLIARQADPKRIAALMRRVAPDLRVDSGHRFEVTKEEHDALPVRYLFGRNHRTGTLLLWLAYFMSLLMIYFIMSWLPAILRQTTLPASAGAIATILFSVGGVIGTLITGRLLLLASPPRIVLIEFGCTALLIGALAYSHDRYVMIMALSTILGATAQGAQAGLNAIAAAYYPTPARSTGLGWASAAGRVGSVVGPLFGGLMLAMQWSVQDILLSAALPACGAGLALLLGQRKLRAVAG